MTDSSCAAASSGKAASTTKWARVKEGIYRRIRGDTPKREDPYFAVIEYAVKDGRRDKRWFGPFETCERATEERDKRRLEASTGTDIDPRRVRFDEFLDRWLALQSEKAKPISPNTKRMYKYIIERRLKPSFRNCKLSKLSPMMISSAVGLWANGPRFDKRTEALSSRSLQAASVVLKMALRQGAKWNLIRHELLLAIEPQSVPRHDPAYVSGQDLKKLFEAARASDPLIMSPAVRVTVGLGLRRAEVLGLQHGDVNFDEGTVRVDRSLQRIDGKLVTVQPKTKLSRRVLHAPQFVLEAIRDIRTPLLSRRMADGAGKIPDDRFIFCDANGEPLDPDNFSKRFSTVAKNAGLPHVHLHSLRHGYAVLGLEAGVDLKTISASLGHSSIRLTGDTYSHVVTSVKRDAADRIGALVEARIAASE